MKSPVWKLILAALLVYMAYSNIRILAALPLSQWGGEQWVLGVVSVALVGTAILCLVRYRREAGVAAAEKAEEEAARLKAAAEKRQQETEQWLAEADEIAGTEGATTRMRDAEGALMEKELAELDSYEELGEYELLDVSSVVPPQEAAQPPAESPKTEN